MNCFIFFDTCPRRSYVFVATKTSESARPTETVVSGGDRGNFRATARKLSVMTRKGKKSPKIRSICHYLQTLKSIDKFRGYAILIAGREIFMNDGTPGPITWLGLLSMPIVGIVVVGFFLLWLAISNRQPMQARPIDQNMVQQLSSLSQGDLIEELDVRRVFYVRAVFASCPSIQFIEWVGNRSYTISIKDMARRPENIKIIRMTDPEWPEYAKRFARQ